MPARSRSHHRRPEAGTDRPEATGVVLAGGRSTRFGRDKLVEPYRDAPMFHHVVLRLAEVCVEVVVVLSPNGEEPGLPVAIPVRIARDEIEDQGPLAGVRAGLAAVRSELVVIAGGDMPDLQLAVLRAMLRIAAKTPADAVALTDGGRLRPLPCVVRREPAVEAAPALLRSGRRRLRDLLDELRVVVVPESTWLALDPGRRTLFDVDVPADLAR